MDIICTQVNRQRKAQSRKQEAESSEQKKHTRQMSLAAKL
jgi:hypothetical protein